MKGYLVYAEGNLYGHEFAGGLEYKAEDNSCFGAADILSTFIGKPYWYFKNFADARGWFHEVILTEIKCNRCYSATNIILLPEGGYRVEANCPKCPSSPKHPVTHQPISWEKLLS